MNVPSLFITGFAAAFLFNYSAYMLFWHHPRYMLFQLPQFFQQGQDGRQTTTKEDTRRFRFYFYMMFLFILLGAAAVCAATHSRGVSFWTLFLYGYLVVMFMNIGDVLVLDILLMVKWRDRITASCHVYPENWTLRNILRKHTLPEHGLLY